METVNPYQAPAADVTTRPSGEDVDLSSAFTPSGRFGRLSYLAWSFGLSIAAGLVLALLAFMLELITGGSGIGGMFTIVGQIAVGVVTIVFAIRRLHDFNANGWWAVLMVIPLANLVLALVLIFKPGTPGPNRFAPPRITQGWETVVGYIAIGMMVLGLFGIFIAIATIGLSGITANL